MTSPRETPPPAAGSERPPGPDAPAAASPAPPEGPPERGPGEPPPAPRPAADAGAPPTRSPGGYLGPVQRSGPTTQPPTTQPPPAAPPGAGAPRSGALPAPKDAGAARGHGPSPADFGPGWAAAGRREGAVQPMTVLPAGAAPNRPPRPVPPRPAGRPAEARPPAARPTAPRTRRARLALRRIDPWSVFVFSLVASVFLGIALVVAVAVLFAVLGSLGVTESVNQLYAEVTGDSPGAEPLLTSGRIVGGAAVLAAVNVVLLTLLATLGALLYNLCASFTGGLELTLGERD